MLVYRVEHPESKCGPYQFTYLRERGFHALAALAESINGKHMADYWPNYYQDFDFGQIPNKGAYRFAFDCEQNLLDWFNGCIDELDEHGYKLYIFDSTDVQYGKSQKQVMFHLALSELIETKSLKEIA